MSMTTTLAPSALGLEGGPMNGWVVKPDAPALRADWHRTWPLGVARQWQPGRYVRDGQRAQWTSDA